jgi:hypothetical protein
MESADEADATRTARDGRKSREAREKREARENRGSPSAGTAGETTTGESSGQRPATGRTTGNGVRDTAGNGAGDAAENGAGSTAGGRDELTARIEELRARVRAANRRSLAGPDSPSLGPPSGRNDGDDTEAWSFPS